MTSFELLLQLVGRWVGKGRGEYPTIKSFEYTEETTFLAAPEYPMLRFEQRTWLFPDRKPSHWEVGLWRVVDGGDVEVSTAQDSGRVEVLRGQVVPDSTGGIKIELSSRCISNDNRLIQTERVISVRDRCLHYVKHMMTTTTETPVRAKHLEASLERVAGA